MGRHFISNLFKSYFILIECNLSHWSSIFITPLFAQTCLKVPSLCTLLAVYKMSNFYTCFLEFCKILLSSQQSKSIQWLISNFWTKSKFTLYVYVYHAVESCNCIYTRYLSLHLHQVNLLKNTLVDCLQNWTGPSPEMGATKDDHFKTIPINPLSDQNYTQNRWRINLFQWIVYYITVLFVSHFHIPT